MINSELFHKIADVIEKHPELYDQEVWGAETSCGTAHCIAGHACALSGYRPTNPYSPHSWVDVAREGESGQCVERTAQELLGLEEQEAWNLFDGCFEPKSGDIVQTLRDIADGRIAPLEA